MATIASLNAVFGMKTSGFEKGAKKISRKTKKMADDMRKSRSFMKGDFFGTASMKQATVALAGLTTGVVAYTRSLAGAMDETAKFSRRIGVSIEEMQKLQLVNKMAGESNGTLSNGLQKMQRAINEASDGVDTYADIFDRLNLSVDDLMQMTPDKQLRTIAKSMDNVKNNTTATATAMELFGTKGAGLINTMKGLDAELEKIEGNKDIMKGILSAEQVKRFETVNDDFAKLGVIIQGSIADNIEQVNFLIKQFANATTFAFKKWREGSVWVEKTAMSLLTSSEERSRYRAAEREAQERSKIREEKLLIIEKQQTAELRKQAKINERAKNDRLSFAQMANSLIESEMTDTQKALRDFNDLVKLQEKTGAFGPRAQKAINIASKKVDAMVEKEKQAQIDKIKAVKKESEEKIKSAERVKKIESENIKSFKILEFDKSIGKVKEQIKAIKDEDVSERKLGFAQTVSKGVTSKGLASGNTQINKQQLNTQKKQLDVAKETLSELKKKRKLIAG